MFDKLEDLLRRFEEIMNMLSEPDITSDQKRFTALMKEQSDLTPIIEAYKEYKQCKQDIEDSFLKLAVIAAYSFFLGSIAVVIIIASFIAFISQMLIHF